MKQNTNSINNIVKINQLLQTHPVGVVLLAAWMENNGYSRSLQQRYVKSQWLQSIGRGAFIRCNDKVGYEGAIYALQEQAGLTIHVGGRTALSLLGKAQYLDLGNQIITLFGQQGEKLPLWFKNHNWGTEIMYSESSFLPADTGMTDFLLGNFSMKISGAARAMMECLYLAPAKQEITECYDLMEGLNNLSPSTIQLLLEQCQSVKVKRLFLYLAEKSGHGWFKHLDISRIDLGSGKRSLVKNGKLVEKYAITVPRELEENGTNL